MILTTTNTIDDYKIAAYRGIVTATVVNLQKTSMTFNTEKYYAGMSDSIDEIKAKALEKLEKKAEILNADAVIGINIDIEVNASDYSVTISVTGTAVSIVKR